MKRLFFLSLVIISCQLLIAQETTINPTKKELTLEEQTIYDLKHGGVLLVRLVSDRRKISELDKRVASNPNDTKTKERLRQVRADRKAFNREWSEALREHYKFSEIYFFYDYDAKRLVDGERSGFFLDDDLHVDKNIKLDRPFVVLGEGAAGDSGISAFIVMDESIRPLSRPFPYYFKKNDFWKVLFSVFDSKTPRHRNLDKVAKEINDAFDRYYEKSFS